MTIFIVLLHVWILKEEWDGYLILCCIPTMMRTDGFIFTSVTAVMIVMSLVEKLGAQFPRTSWCEEKLEEKDGSLTDKKVINVLEPAFWSSLGRSDLSVYLRDVKIELSVISSFVEKLSSFINEYKIYKSVSSEGRSFKSLTKEEKEALYDFIAIGRVTTQISYLMAVITSINSVIR